jgi:hypothetical protein
MRDDAIALGQRLNELLLPASRRWLARPSGLRRNDSNISNVHSGAHIPKSQVASIISVLIHVW